jgi:hypothetical protein
MLMSSYKCLLFFGFYGLEKKTSLQYELCISLIIQARDTKIYGSTHLVPINLNAKVGDL